MSELVISSKHAVLGKNEINDPPCTEKCKSLQHGKEVWEIGLKGSDEEIISMWENICCNYAHVKDEFGRTALHAVACMGKVKVSFLLIYHHVQYDYLLPILYYPS